jgi:hypothetical protein
MDEDTLTVWLDTALLMLGGFVLMTILMLTAINPPAKSAEVAGEQSPGNLIIEASWEGKLDADVDLWAKAPGDRPVGYSNPSGKVFNLLRDDRGTVEDITDINGEIVYSRGIPPGEYIVNVHTYRAGLDVRFPVEVKVAARLKKTTTGSAHLLIARTVKLLGENQEITVFRFTLDQNGDLVPGSTNHLFKELRVAEQ